MSTLTPIGSRLQISLDAERLRMANEWFFRWHHIGREGPVEIDSFNGRIIKPAGIMFSGSARTSYWDIIQRYARQKVSALFDDLEADIQRYPIEVRRKALNEALSLMRVFVAGIRREAIKTDRVLRGDGSTFPPEQDLGNWNGANGSDIEARVETLRHIYCDLAAAKGGVEKVFDDLMNDRVTLVKRDGTVSKENITSLVAAGSIQINDQSLLMEPNDHLLRTLPNGLVEDYIIVDPQFHAGFGGIESFWTVKVRRSNAPAAQTGVTIQRITNNFHGANSRVNIASTDLSTNTATSFDPAKLQALIEQVRPAIGALPQPQRDAIQAPLALLEDEVRSGAPTDSKVALALQSIKSVAEEVTGNLIAAGIVGLVAPLLTSPGA